MFTFLLFSPNNWTTSYNIYIYIFSFFQTVSQYKTQAGLEFTIFLVQSRRALVTVVLCLLHFA